jgi:SulP family sulfate permease
VRDALPSKAFLPVLPILTWGRRYSGAEFASDFTAALIVTLMLIPQSLAYAALAGLPAQAGLYASVAPLVAYALLGSSRVLAVGPVAVVSMMTAAAVSNQLAMGQHGAWEIAITLAFLSGLMLLLMGLLKLGFVANFLSHPVISSFITASALLILASQLKTLLGVSAQGQHFFELVFSLGAEFRQIHGLTALLGGGCLVSLIWLRSRLAPLLMARGWSQRWAAIVVRVAPVMLLVLTSVLTWHFQWQNQGLAVVGAVPAGLAPLTWPVFDATLWKALALPALLISVVGFVESVSVAQTLAAKHRERIEPDQELLALGAGNLAAALSAGFPVTGGFARSVVNFDAGSKTQAAGLFTAAGIVLASLFLTPALFYLPKASLAATIVVAVMGLMDFSVLKRTWNYSRSDFVAALSTLLLTLLAGVEVGLCAGLSVSLLLFLFRTSRPHIATVGLVPGTQSFRNVLRHQVITCPRVMGLRVDESLYFANSRALEDYINDAVASHPLLEHVVLQCSAINDIDASALESLEAIEKRLRDSNIKFHLSEVKGPIMDRLKTTGFLRQLSGEVFLTHYQAIAKWSPESLR